MCQIFLRLFAHGAKTEAYVDRVPFLGCSKEVIFLGMQLFGMLLRLISKE